MDFRLKLDDHGFSLNSIKTQLDIIMSAAEEEILNNFSNRIRTEIILVKIAYKCTPIWEKP